MQYHDKEPFKAVETGVASGNDFIVDARDAETNAAIIAFVVVGADADVYFEADPDDDGTFDFSVKIGSITGPDIQNVIGIPLDRRGGTKIPTRLRLNNTGNSSGDFGAVGKEI